MSCRFGGSTRRGSLILSSCDNRLLHRPLYTSGYMLLANDFSTRFRGRRLDLAELHSLLLQRFKGAMQPMPTELLYPGDMKRYSVKVRIRDLSVEDIEPGAGLGTGELDALWNQIESDLLMSNGMRIGSAILFSHLPVEGWYRYEELLQILPAPKGAPRPAFLMADHPFLLQFAFPSSPNWLIRNVRKAIRGREITLMLTGLLAGTVRSLIGGGQHHWSLVSTEPGGTLRTEYLQEGYLCPAFVEESEEFERN